MEEELIKRIIAGENAAIEQLYRDHFNKVKSIVMKNGGDLDDAKDHMQDSIIQLIENLKSGKFMRKSKLGTYFVSIAKFKWLEKIRKDIKERENKSTLEDNYYETDPYYIELEESSLDINDHVQEQMKNISEDCQEIIKLFYSIKLPMKVIAEKLGLTNSFVRVKKLRCVNYLRTNLLEIPEVKEKYGYGY